MKKTPSLCKLPSRFDLIPLLLVFSYALSTGCASSPNNSGKPEWVDNVNSVYNKSHYVAAVGYAADRETAEKNALANLAAFFGQSIKADQTIANTYYEAARNGVSTGWIDTIAMRNVITTSVSMDTLIGAEIREVWHDTKNNVFYAVAVMERAQTIQLYTDMIRANLEMINNLTGMNQAERTALEGVSRYQFAGAAADINIAYANLLKLLNAPVPGGIKSGDEYRLEARNISRAIAIDVIVSNDRENRLHSAFAKVFTGLGFVTGGRNSRYALRVTAGLSPVDFPNNPNTFVLMELNASLTDTGAKEVLLPFGFTIREGHTTAAGAENRVFISAEKKIEEEFSVALNAYLSRLLPAR